MKKYRIVGINDDQDTCQCCGKTGLKRVVWMVPIDVDGNPEGEPECYGTSCAARIAGYAYPTSAGTKRKIELEAYRMAEETISKRIEQIRKDHCTIVFRSEFPVGRFFIGKDMLDAYNMGDYTLQECMEALRSRFPILRYLDGKMDRNNALALAMVHE